MLHDPLRPICLTQTQRYPNLMISTVQTVENTHHPKYLCTPQFCLPTQHKLRKRMPIFNCNKIHTEQQQQGTPIARVGGLRFKTINSAELSINDQRIQPFQSQNPIRSCYSQQKNTTRRPSLRKHKIFDTNYQKTRGQHVTPIYPDNNKQIEEDSTRNLVQKLQKMFSGKEKQQLQHSLYIPEKPFEEQFSSVICNQQTQNPPTVSINYNAQQSRIHATPNTVFNPQSVTAANQKKNITFTYHNTQQVLTPNLSIRAHPLAQSYNVPALSPQSIINNPFPKLYSQSYVAEYVNPAMPKIKNQFVPINAANEQHNFISKNNQDFNIKISQTVKNNYRVATQKNHFCQQAKISRTSAQLKESLIRSGTRLTNGNIETAKSFSNIEEVNTDRYFDDQDPLPLMAKKISYNNIEISKKEEESLQQPQIDPRNLFIDFQASRRKSMQKQPILISLPSKQSIINEGTMILSTSTLQIIQSNQKKTFKIQNLLPKILILLAVLILVLQMIS